MQLIINKNPEPVHLKAVLITTPRHPVREAKCPGTDNRFTFATTSLEFLSCESLFSSLFNDAISIQTIQRRTIRRLINTPLVGIWNELIVAKSRHYPDICLKGLRKIRKTVRISGVPSEIRTEHLPNTSQAPYRSTILFGVRVLPQRGP
jgi:hypothetical protein